MGLPAALAAEPMCAACGKPASCLGAYEGEERAEYACDVCCGHGNEDGHCDRIPLAGEPKPDTKESPSEWAKRVAEMEVPDADARKMSQHETEMRLKQGDISSQPNFDPKALVGQMIDEVEEPKPGIGSQAEVDSLLEQGKFATEREPGCICEATGLDGRLLFSSKCPVHNPIGKNHKLSTVSDASNLGRPKG